MCGGVGAERFERVERVSIEPRAAHPIDVKIDQARRHRASERKFYVEELRTVIDCGDPSVLNSDASLTRRSVARGDERRTDGAGFHVLRP
jgi:hypothetical protein